MTEIPPISYNEFMREFGGSYANFANRSLAYMLQQRPDLDAQTRESWESKLQGINKITGRENENNN